MKKIILVLSMVLMLFCFTSCDMRIRDSEGWLLWNLSSLTGDWVMVQSYEGFMVVDNTGTGIFYKEQVFDFPVTIENVLNKEIDVKVSSNIKPDYWVKIPVNSFLELTETTSEVHQND